MCVALCEPIGADRRHTSGMTSVVWRVGVLLVAGVLVVGGCAPGDEPASDSVAPIASSSSQPPVTPPTELTLLRDELLAAQDAASAAEERAANAEAEGSGLEERLSGTLGELDRLRELNGRISEQLRLLSALQRQASRAQGLESLLLTNPRDVASVRDGCGVEGSLAEDYLERSVVVGPLALLLLPQEAERPASEFAPVGVSKVVAVVDAGQTVTVVVPARSRHDVALTYASSAEPAVTFSACDERTAQFPGGFVVAGAQCVRLDVWVGDAEDPVSVTVSFGAGSC